MIVRSVGFKRGGRPATHNLGEGATIADVARELDINAGQASFMLDGNQVNPGTVLYEGAMVSYTMTNIKGA